jgi:hypothetical protein
MAMTKQKSAWIDPTKSVSTIPNTNAQKQSTMKADTQPHPNEKVKSLCDAGGFTQSGIGAGPDGSISTDKWTGSTGDASDTSAVDSGEDTAYA